jgi:copper chaperone CopZ
LHKEFKHESDKDMETVKLKIPNMMSGHCQMTVSNTVGKLKGAQIKNIKPGEAEIDLDTEETSKAQVVEAIEQAGYRVENK